SPIDGKQPLCLRARQRFTGAERPPLSPIFEAAATRARPGGRGPNGADTFKSDVTHDVAKGDEEVVRVTSRVGVRQFKASRSAQRPLPRRPVSPVHPKDVRWLPADADREPELVPLQGDRPSSNSLRTEEVDGAVAARIPRGGQLAFVPDATVVH